jgi:hypothetical protein
MASHNQARVDLCERHYGDDDWWFLTYRGAGWGLESRVAGPVTAVYRLILAFADRLCGLRAPGGSGGDRYRPHQRQPRPA